MGPILTAIAGVFAQEGLGLLAGAVKGGGDKAVDYIQSKTGIDVKDIADPATETAMTPEQRSTLKQLEVDKVVRLAGIVAGADKGKTGGIVIMAIASEIPELLLFAMGLAIIGGLAAFGKNDDAMQLAGIWFGAMAMYVKGK